MIYDFIRFENDFPFFSFERFSNDYIPKFRKLTMSSSEDPNVGNKSAAAKVVTIRGSERNKPRIAAFTEELFFYS